jgi:AcrR family transcriptional regulator
VTQSRSARGPYAKGVLRRQQIIDAATEVLEAHGLRGSTLEDIAARVGLTRAGLLHYFGSREALLVAVFEQRDAQDIAAGTQNTVPGESVADSFERVVRRTRESPGMARLHTQLAAEAVDPAHPLHGYFRDRYAQVRRMTQETIHQGVRAGALSDAIDPASAGIQILALLDGLQLQWLLDPELDTTTALRTASATILPSAPSSPHQGGSSAG